jgi:hypothetical protein
MDSRAHDEVLRDIVRSVEQNTDLDPEHPDLLELKRILLEKIAPVEAGDSGSDMAASADPSAALPVDVSVSQALGLGATGDPPALPADTAVSQALGLGAPSGPPASRIEISDSQPSGLSAEDPSVPPIDSA